MSIWFQEIGLEDLQKRSAGTLSDYLGIRFTEITANSMSAVMPVQDHLKQPMGIVHGGANVVLAETLASTAANFAVDFSKYYCVGLEINANHIRPVRTGEISATTTAIHIGRLTQIWSIELRNSAGKINCISRMAASVLERS